MSDQGLLYQYIPHEVPPPTEIWERIRISLDEEEKSEAAFKALADASDPPPDSAWENIVLRLQEQDQRKEQESIAVLLNIGVDPPPIIWQDIDAELNRQKVKSLPQHRKKVFTIGLAIAVAASITGIVLLVQPLIKQDSHSPTYSNLAQHTHPLKIPTKNRDSHPESVASKNQNPSGIIQNLKKPTQPPSLASINSNHSDTEETQYLADVQTATSIFAPINSASGEVLKNKEKQRDLNGDIIEKVSDYQAFSTTYAKVYGPYGGNVRVSVKLTNMIEYFDDDDTAIKGGINDVSKVEYLDRVLKESGRWKWQFLTWKINVIEDVQNLSVNFANPLELIKYLQKRK